MPKPYTPNDKWAQKAQQEGYRARSVYKLMELDERFSLIQPGMKVLDIGAAPGSWLQYTSKMLGGGGKVLGVDRTPIEHVSPNVVTLQCDVFNATELEAAISAQGWTKVDLILSDIAPNTSGIRDVDQWRSIELNQQIVELAKKWLRPHGHLVMKVLRGADFDEFLHEVMPFFNKAKTVTVEASRDRSNEVYIVCLGKK